MLTAQHQAGAGTSQHDDETDQDASSLPAAAAPPAAAAGTLSPLTSDPATTMGAPPAPQASATARPFSPVKQLLAAYQGVLPAGGAATYAADAAEDTDEVADQADLTPGTGPVGTAGPAARSITSPIASPAITAAPAVADSSAAVTASPEQTAQPSAPGSPVAIAGTTSGSVSPLTPSTITSPFTTPASGTTTTAAQPPAPAPAATPPETSSTTQSATTAATGAAATSAAAPSSSATALPAATAPMSSSPVPGPHIFGSDSIDVEVLDRPAGSGGDSEALLPAVAEGTESSSYVLVSDRAGSGSNGISSAERGSGEEVAQPGAATGQGEQPAAGQLGLATSQLQQETATAGDADVAAATAAMPAAREEAEAEAGSDQSAGVAVPAPAPVEASTSVSPRPAQATNPPTSPFTSPELQQPASSPTSQSPQPGATTQPPSAATTTPPAPAAATEPEANTPEPSPPTEAAEPSLTSSTPQPAAAGSPPATPTGRPGSPGPMLPANTLELLPPEELLMPTFQQRADSGASTGPEQQQEQPQEQVPQAPGEAPLPPPPVPAEPAAAEPGEPDITTAVFTPAGIAAAASTLAAAAVLRPGQEHQGTADDTSGASQAAAMCGAAMALASAVGSAVGRPGEAVHALPGQPGHGHGQASLLSTTSTNLSTVTQQPDMTIMEQSQPEARGATSAVSTAGQAGESKAGRHAPALPMAMLTRLADPAAAGGPSHGHPSSLVSSSSSSPDLAGVDAAMQQVEADAGMGNLATATAVAGQVLAAAQPAVQPYLRRLGSSASAGSAESSSGAAGRPSLAAGGGGERRSRLAAGGQQVEQKEEQEGGGEEDEGGEEEELLGCAGGSSAMAAGFSLKAAGAGTAEQGLASSDAAAAEAGELGSPTTRAQEAPLLGTGYPAEPEASHMPSASASTFLMPAQAQGTMMARHESAASLASDWGSTAAQQEEEQEVLQISPSLPYEPLEDELAFDAAGLPDVHVSQAAAAAEAQVQQEEGVEGAAVSLGAGREHSGYVALTVAPLLPGTAARAAGATEPAALEGSAAGSVPPAAPAAGDAGQLQAQVSSTGAQHHSQVPAMVQHPMAALQLPLAPALPALEAAEHLGLTSPTVLTVPVSLAAATAAAAAAEEPLQQPAAASALPAPEAHAELLVPMAAAMPAVAAAEQLGITRHSAADSLAVPLTTAQAEAVLHAAELEAGTPGPLGSHHHPAATTAVPAPTSSETTSVTAAAGGSFSPVTALQPRGVPEAGTSPSTSTGAAGAALLSPAVIQAQRARLATITSSNLAALDQLVGQDLAALQQEVEQKATGPEESPAPLPSAERAWLQSHSQPSPSFMAAGYSPGHGQEEEEDELAAVAQDMAAAAELVLGGMAAGGLGAGPGAPASLADGGSVPGRVLSYSPQNAAGTAASHGVQYAEPGSTAAQFIAEGSGASSAAGAVLDTAAAAPSPGTLPSSPATASSLAPTLTLTSPTAATPMAAAATIDVETGLDGCTPVAAQAAIGTPAASLEAETAGLVAAGGQLGFSPGLWETPAAAEPLPAAASPAAAPALPSPPSAEQHATPSAPPAPGHADAASPSAFATAAANVDRQVASEAAADGLPRQLEYPMEEPPAAVERAAVSEPAPEPGTGAGAASMTGGGAIGPLPAALTAAVVAGRGAVSPRRALNAETQAEAEGDEAGTQLRLPGAGAPPVLAAVAADSEAAARRTSAVPSAEETTITTTTSSAGEQALLGSAASQEVVPAPRVLLLSEAQSMSEVEPLLTVPLLAQSEQYSPEAVAAAAGAEGQEEAGEQVAGLEAGPAGAASESAAEGHAVARQEAAASGSTGTAAEAVALPALPAGSPTASEEQAASCYVEQAVPASATTVYTALAADNTPGEVEETAAPGPSPSGAAGTAATAAADEPEVLEQEEQEEGGSRQGPTLMAAPGSQGMPQELLQPLLGSSTPADDYDMPSSMAVEEEEETGGGGLAEAQRGVAETAGTRDAGAAVQEAADAASIAGYAEGAGGAAAEQQGDAAASEAAGNPAMSLPSAAEHEDREDAQLVAHLVADALQSVTAPAAAGTPAAAAAAAAPAVAAGGAGAGQAAAQGSQPAAVKCERHDSAASFARQAAAQPPGPMVGAPERQARDAGAGRAYEAASEAAAEASAAALAAGDSTGAPVSSAAEELYRLINQPVESSEGAAEQVPAGTAGSLGSAAQDSAGTPSAPSPAAAAAGPAARLPAEEEAPLAVVPASSASATEPMAAGSPGAAGAASDDDSEELLGDETAAWEVGRRLRQQQAAAEGAQPGPAPSPPAAVDSPAAAETAGEPVAAAALPGVAFVVAGSVEPEQPGGSDAGSDGRSSSSAGPVFDGGEAAVLQQAVRKAQAGAAFEAGSGGEGVLQQQQQQEEAIGVEDKEGEEGVLQEEEGEEEEEEEATGVVEDNEGEEESAAALPLALPVSTGGDGLAAADIMPAAVLPGTVAAGEELLAGGVGREAAGAGGSGAPAAGSPLLPAEPGHKEEDGHKAEGEEHAAAGTGSSPFATVGAQEAAGAEALPATPAAAAAKPTAAGARTSTGPGTAGMAGGALGATSAAGLQQEELVQGQEGASAGPALEKISGSLTPQIVSQDSVSLHYTHTASSKEVAGSDYIEGCDPDEISPGWQQPRQAALLSLLVTWGALWVVTRGLGKVAQVLLDWWAEAWSGLR